MAAAAAAAIVVWAAWPDPAVPTEHHLITVDSSEEAVVLDATLYLPPAASGAAPAVLLAHGLGGTEASVREEGERLARAGYVVLAWTARGFGDSGGLSHLNHPDYEVRDAVALVDWLARRPEVLADAAGDPRVAVVGSSYGGALALLLAGTDPRLDAVVARITWNDLAASLTGASGSGEGALKQFWVGSLFGAGFEGGGGQACGRWSPDVCRAFFALGDDPPLDREVRRMLEERSPASVLERVTAPTLLIQGSADSLFPLSEADANAAGIAAAGTPVQVAWYTGGHDGGPGPPSDRSRLDGLTADWLGHHLRGDENGGRAGFTFSRQVGLDPVERSRLTVAYQTAEYPGMAGERRLEVEVAGGPRSVVHPPNGLPAALGALPAAVADFVGGLPVEIPGQSGRWSSSPLPESITVVGSPIVRLRAASASGSALLFVRLEVVDATGEVVRRGLSTPVRLAGLSPTLDGAGFRQVTLPGVVEEVGAGQAVAVSVSTTDPTFRSGREAAVYQVEVAGPVGLPVVEATVVGGGSGRWVAAAGGATLAVAAGIVLAAWQGRRRRRRREASPAVSDAVPLRVEGLRKEFDGLVAVDGAGFVVGRDQVVGLLGPNGAGKTTALRAILGLIPAEGEIHLFGRRSEPGASVLARVGALVEGPGFLPHLSGRRNLEYYWAAGGRPREEAGFDRVLAIAGLGSAIERRVGDYSHGMKQRLAVAQAMLGMPELLVLDEPTDGLDPPQIAAMRRVLAGYARDGRSVLVSSHLLSEVEQTCSHVVVMDRGRVVAAGPVREVVGAGSLTAFGVADVEATLEVVAALGLAGHQEGDGVVVVELGSAPRHLVVAALAAAGVAIDSVVPRRRLEEAFLALVGRPDPEMPA